MGSGECAPHGTGTLYLNLYLHLHLSRASCCKTLRRFIQLRAVHLVKLVGARECECECAPRATCSPAFGALCAHMASEAGAGARHRHAARAPAPAPLALAARASDWLRELWAFAAHRSYVPLYVTYFCFWGGARALTSSCNLPLTWAFGLLLVLLCWMSTASTANISTHERRDIR